MTGKIVVRKWWNFWLYAWMPIFFQMAGIEFASSQIDGEAVLQAVDGYRAPSENFVFESVVRSSDDRIELTVHIREFTKGLVRFTNPSDFAGRSILYVDENMWIYVPGTRRALRISPNQRMLAGVSSADVSRTVFARDYNVKSFAENGDFLNLELVAKNSKSAYARIKLFVDSFSHKPTSAEFYARSGERLLKTMHFEDYREVLGKQRPMRSRIVDHVENDSETIIQFVDMRIEDTPEAWFQPSYLGRL